MKIISLSTKAATGMRNGDLDANNLPAEILRSDGNANECRHCMEFIEKDEPMLLFGHRPFDKLQAFAETGPVLMHQRSCKRYAKNVLPSIYAEREMIIRAYTEDDRIIYGTGRVVHMRQFESVTQALFELASVAYVHVRSASNNCYHFRVERSSRH